ncbi:MAG: tryptophanase [Candidatus Paceibacterota bacterium]|nr:tryptophanase [Candidatus Paceibacterota bacterium]
MNKFTQLTEFTPKHQHRAYVNSAVRFHTPCTKEDRLAAAIKAGWNVFQFPSKFTVGDFLSDSGTTTPTIEQLAASLLGDEAYGTNWGYEQLLEQFEKTFGITLLGDDAEWEIFLFHQCRAAEHALFTQIGRGKKGLIIPSNGHFDTTHANIEMNGIEALDIVSVNDHFFLGNIDTTKLFRTLNTENVPLVYCTVTNNTMAGQPVSLENIADIRRWCDKFKKPFFLDACRFAENAWFIKENERQRSTIPEIVHEMFSLCDGFTISLKKDGLANMGGALCVKKGTVLFEEYPDILDNLRDHQICTEAHPTYGGMSGRDIMIVVEGLKTVVTQEYLDSRILQVRAFGDYLDELGIPVVKPFGGHAVYLDVDKFYEGTLMRREDFGGISLTALLLLNGPRLCELGAFAFGTYDPKTGKETFPPFNYVRIAIPRNKYEIEDLFYAADCIKNLHNKRDFIPRAVCTHGKEKTLRHFKARFELQYK